MASILDNPAIRQAAMTVSVQQYHQLGEAGVLRKETELLRGVIVEKMIKSPLHSWLVQRLADTLRSSIGQGMHVRQEQPLTLEDSEPEPDLAIVQGVPDDYRHAHPSAAVVVLEVAIASVAIDREKASIYSAAGVSEYWLVLAEERAIEVFSDPSSAGYRRTRRFEGAEQAVSLALPGLEVELSWLFS